LERETQQSGSHGVILLCDVDLDRVDGGASGYARGPGL
jgi:hypothetical protein